MEKSESINELATALAKAQGEIEAAEKGSVNPHFNKTYADLASVWKACRSPLSKNGLSITQGAATNGNQVVVTTLLMHNSGQWNKSQLALTPEKMTPQGIGSAITYGRRFLLAAMVGVAPDEDDDGNEATQAGRSAPGSKSSPPVSPKTQSQPKANPEPPVRSGPSDAQIKRLYAIVHQAEQQTRWREEEVKGFMKEALGLESTKDLSLRQYDWLCNLVEKGTFQQALMELDKSRNPSQSSEPPQQEDPNAFTNYR